MSMLSHPYWWIALQHAAVTARLSEYTVLASYFCHFQSSGEPCYMLMVGEVVFAKKNLFAREANQGKLVVLTLLPQPLLLNEV